MPELVGTLATVTVPFSLEGFVYTPESFQSGGIGQQDQDCSVKARSR